MPEREMRHAKVYLSETGDICIQQDKLGNNALITIHPDQVELLTKWLNDIKPVPWFGIVPPGSIVEASK